MGNTRFRFMVLALVLPLTLAGCTTNDNGTGDDGDQGDAGAAHATIMEKAREIAPSLDTPEEAWDAGYRPDTICVPGMGVHWINMDAFDTELDEDEPEVVLFLPATSNVTDTEGATFLGIEYVVATEGTDMNTTETVPRLHGVPLVGPMPGHFPGMPYHAELHVYLADGLESTPDFEESNDDIVCPEGTSPPEAHILAKARELAKGLDTGEKALAAGYMPTSVCDQNMGVHWVKMSAFDPVFDEDEPEVAMMLPGEGGIYDTANATLIGLEYVVITEGTDMNTTETVPRFHGRAFDGPMPGHFPGMPYHAEMHIYLGPDQDWPPFGHMDEGQDSHFHDLVDCPEGTQAPPMLSADLKAVTPEGIGDDQGNVTIVEGPFLGQVSVTVMVSGLDPGEHGVHIHTNGDCSPASLGGGPVGAGAAGGHFNPDNASHGEHAGDLGNLVVADDGTGTATFQANVTLEPDAMRSVVGRSLIVHQDADDGETDPSGNSGARVLCGVLGSA